MKQRTRGFALVLVLFLTFVLSILAYAAARVASLDARGAAAEIKSAGALFAARAGVARALVRLGKDINWASSAAVTETIGEGYYTVESHFYPGIKWWKVTSTGVVGDVSHTVDAWVGPLSFAEFAYFSDSELSPTGGSVYFITADQLTGKVHTNGYFSVMGHPKFTKRVTSSNVASFDGSHNPSSYDPYYNTRTGAYNQGRTSTTDRTKFYHYDSSYTTDSMQALNGSPSFSFQGLVAPYDLGAHTDMAYIETQATVRIPASGSISANVTTVFNSDGSVTISYPGDTGRSPKWSAFNQTYTLDEKSILYIDTASGYGVTTHGTVKGRVTLAATQFVNIDDNLVYSDKNADVLGIVANASNVTSGSSITRTAIQVTTDPYTAKDIEIDATMYCPNGSFGVDDYDRGYPRGTLSIYGGIIQVRRGPVGTSSGGRVATGYAKNYVFDPQLIQSPPPTYPVTGKVYIKSFQDRGALR
jgi:hypothetical protein